MVLGKIGSSTRARELARRCFRAAKFDSVSVVRYARTVLHVVDVNCPSPNCPSCRATKIVGRIEEIGASVEVLKRVIVSGSWLGLDSGVDFCRRGRRILSQRALTGYQIDGGFAEETIADARTSFRPALHRRESAPLSPGLIVGVRFKAAGRCAETGFYGFGAARILRSSGAPSRSDVYGFVRPGDEKRRRLASAMGAVWRETRTPRPRALDAAVIFAPGESLCPRRCGRCARRPSSAPASI